VPSTKFSSANKAFGLHKRRLFLSDVYLAAAVTIQDACNKQYKAARLIQLLRGGSTEAVDSDSEDEEEYDSEEEYDEESEEESEGEEDATSESLAASIQNKVANQPYDTLLTPPPMQQMLVSISVMLLSQRIDIFSPKVVAIARAAFIGYIVAVQLFLLYVRTRVKQINNRTEITISNPLASLVQGMTSQGGSQNTMVKSLTSQILTTHTTIYEYDMQQIKSMQSGLLMPMVFIYFLHFRMKQMQPLLMQTATGVMNLVYSPLWQVYVLGRNLERPFKSSGGGVLDGMMAENGADESESGDLEVNVENGEEVDAEENEAVEEAENEHEESSESDKEESEESDEE
jgi:hypothetical protein